MSEILSEAEIEALQRAFAATAPGAPREPAGAVSALDLAGPERSLAGRLPGLELVLGRFARGLRGALATFLGDVPAVAVGQVELVRFAHVLERLEAATGLVRLRLAPLRGHGLLTIPAPLVGALLQVACGGAAERTVALPAREFSPIELRLIERLALRVLAELRAAWEPVAAIECGYVRTEASPLFAAVASPDELCVCADLAITAPGLPPTSLAIVLPHASLDAIRPSLQRVRAVDDGTGTPGDHSWAAQLRARLAEVPVEVTVELGTQRLALSRLATLAVGEVIPLDTGREGPVIVRIAGTPHFVGAPGIANGHNAVRVTARI